MTIPVERAMLCIAEDAIYDGAAPRPRDGRSVHGPVCPDCGSRCVLPLATWIGSVRPGVLAGSAS